MPTPDSDTDAASVDSLNFPSLHSPLSTSFQSLSLSSASALIASFVHVSVCLHWLCEQPVWVCDIVKSAAFLPHSVPFGTLLFCFCVCKFPVIYFNVHLCQSVWLCVHTRALLRRQKVILLFPSTHFCTLHCTAHSFITFAHLLCYIFVVFLVYLQCMAGIMAALRVPFA